MTRYLITSAIPYVNGVKHLGNVIGSMLPADVYSRFRRQQGHETLFICGTDDHGTPVEIAAQKEGVPTADFVAKWHDFQKGIYAGFGLSFDWFGSSSRPPNHALTRHFARKLKDNGLLDMRTQTMLYSAADKRFLPDRYVEGTCPNCGFAKARGDQCDNCGKVLNPTDLINPYSSISGSRDLALRDSQHLYLKQSNLVPQLRAWIDTKADWPVLSTSIAHKWLDEGLEDRGITRDIQWGVPVPTDVFGDAMAGKVFYVWFDAPIAYIAATQEWATAVHGEAQPDEHAGVPLSASAKRWWYGQDDVHYTQFMGKDNVYFHTLSFPSTLIGSGEPWHKVDSLKSFNWLTYYGGKFSTSMGVGIFTDAALELLPPDYWRYYLLSRAPESDDSEFRWTDMQALVNKDLADVLGNFVNRTLQLVNKYYGTVVPPQGELTAAETAFATKLQTQLEALTAHHANSELRKAAEATRALWVLGNEYLAEQEPWKVMKTDPARAATILATAVNLIPFYAATMAPLVPFTASRLWALFGLPEKAHTALPWPTDAKAALTAQASGSAFTLPEVLFTKIADEQVAEWEARYGATKV